MKQDNFNEYDVDQTLVWTPFESIGGFAALDSDGDLWTAPMLVSGERADDSDGCTGLVDWHIIDPEDITKLLAVEKQLKEAKENENGKG